MALKGASAAYCVVGGIILYSGIKGATIADTVKAVISGNLTVTKTEGITTPSASGSNSTASGGSTSNATSGTDSANLLTVAKYMVSNGYSKAAAAGIASCVSGESGGNPEAMESGQSGGGGLIQWTPISAYPGLVTGNATKDLDTQLAAIIKYNNAQGAGLIAMLNSISDPVAAADFYSSKFERPAQTDSDVRSSVATSIFSQLGG